MSGCEGSTRLSVVHWVLGGKFTLDFATASWTLWFLVALAAWRVMLPYLALLRYPLTISIVISVGAGYFNQVDPTGEGGGVATNDEDDRDSAEG